MGTLREILAPLHTRTKRDYVDRMMQDKVECSRVARNYGESYWDGDRKYGYGGYRYDGRWRPVAERLVDIYRLPADARILDVGCGKAHLLYELGQVLPKARLAGFDISTYGIATAKEGIRDRLCVAHAGEGFPFLDGPFDLVISLMVLHNLRLPGVAAALREMERLGSSKYIAVESYRTVKELFNLQCWALTCETFLSPDEWEWFFSQTGYTGDYEFLFFE